MPGYYDDDEDFEQEQSGPKPLRDQLKKLEKALADAKAELEAEKARSADLDKKFKSTTLRDHLRDAGIDPKYASRAERDGVDATPESVKQWIDENKDVYVFLNQPATPADPNDDAGDGDDAGDEDVLPEDLVSGVDAGHRVEAGSRPGGATTVIEALEKVDLTSFTSEAEIDAYIRGLGAPRG